MATIENSLFDIRYMETLASGGSGLHRLDPRAKLLVTFVFICTVVSMDKYEISRMIPFVIYPLVMVVASDLPVLYLGKKILVVAPFAVLVGLFNPFLDTAPLLHLGPVTLSGGWVSFLSILLRFGLTVSAALILLCLTGFNGVCLALEKLKVPGPFVVQLMFLYRYLFVLIEEASRMVRARTLRTFGRPDLGFSIFARLVGQLLLRTLDRAQRIHTAMCCRGFDGHIRISCPLEFGYREMRFVLSWSLFFVLARCHNLPQIVGSIIEGQVL